MAASSTNIGEKSHDDTVLIVEDERMSRRALANLLTASGYRPEAYGSAEEAIEHHPDLSKMRAALIDLDLPGMSGLELIEKLHKCRPGLMAVLITAADLNAVEDYLEKHDVQYMRKPVNFDALLGVLQSTEVQ